MTRRRLAHSPPTPPRLCTRGSGQKLISNLLLMGVRGISTQNPGAASAPKTMTDQVYMDDDRIVAGRKTTALCRRRPVWGRVEVNAEDEYEGS